ACSTAVPSRPRRRPTPPLFPYTTLFRSRKGRHLHQPPRPSAKTQLCADPARGGAAGQRDIHALVGSCRREKRLHDDGGDFCGVEDRKSTRLNSSHQIISYAAFCMEKTTP